MPSSFDLEVSLRGARPRVWRRFLIATSASFYDLHDAIQRACGWQNYHLFSFRTVRTQTEVAGIPDTEKWGNVEVPDAKRVRLADWLGEGSPQIEYEYDFGDGWMHDIKVHGVVEHDEKHKRKLIGGARAFPHEDCGSLGGYQRCARFVKTGKDPWKEGDDDGLRGWLGGWHPDHFDLEATRKQFDPRPARRAVIVPPASAPPARETTREPNAWCAALGIDVPDVAEVASRKTQFGPPKLAELIVVTLLEKGAALTDEEVLAHLTAAGISTGTGDLRRSMKGSLAASRAPLLRDHQGRITVDLKSHDLDLMLFTRGLRGPKVQRPAPVAVSPTEGPLTRDEVDAAFAGRISHSDTKARFVAAVLDGERRPLIFADIVERYVAYGGDRSRFTEADLKRLQKRTDIAVEGDVLRLTDDADLRPMRDGIRKRARSALERRERSGAYEVWRKENEARERRHREAASRLRRAVFTCQPSPEAPTSIEAFDFGAGERKTFLATDPELAGWMSQFDVVAGMRPHLTLGALGVDFHRFEKVVDLLPAKKTHSIEGRQVPITWDAIVTATLGGALEPDGLATMVALYRYGVLHGHVWLPAPRGGYAAGIPIDAGVEGDVRAYWALREAREAGAVVALWVGMPPEAVGPSVRPLNAVLRGRVVELDQDEVVIEDERGAARRVHLALVHGLDVRGGGEFAWRLPITSREG